MLDVRFFSTAVLIQRETGGNLSEILDNLAAVVRERFKIRRQVRVHTAHGRFTGYVLMALPAFLARRALVHQSGAHEPAVRGTHGPDDDHRVDRDAGGRVLLDQASHQDRGVIVTFWLPLLAFAFGSLLVTAVTVRADGEAGRHRRSSARRDGDGSLLPTRRRVERADRWRS